MSDYSVELLPIASLISLRVTVSGVCGWEAIRKRARSVMDESVPIIMRFENEYDSTSVIITTNADQRAHWEEVAEYFGERVYDYPEGMLGAYDDRVEIIPSVYRDGYVWVITMI